jgi:hypothetical protein
VCGVTTRDHLPEMPVLSLDDLVGGLTLVLVVARPTELLACHCFHHSLPFFTSLRLTKPSMVVTQLRLRRPLELIGKRIASCTGRPENASDHWQIEHTGFKAGVTGCVEGGLAG